MTEGRVRVSSGSQNLELAYQSFGSEEAPCFLLITGWFSDLTLWPRAFCEELAGRGYRVVRYDNRDSGLSTRTDPASVKAGEPPYTMSDLAADAVGLLDALTIGKAHIAGLAMGGTIAQNVAFEHPERVLSLTAIATASGAPGFQMPDPSILPLALEPFPTDPEALARHHKRLFAAFAAASFDDADYEERRKESVARGAALARGDLQSGATFSAGDRTPQLGQVRVPVLVVHPELDPLIPMDAARAHVAAYPSADLLVLEGVGHGVLPRRTWPSLVEAMAGLASRARS